MTADRNPAKGWHPSGAVRHSALSSIPLACHSLSVNEHFAGVVHQYTDLAARLQYLSIDLPNWPGAGVLPLILWLHFQTSTVCKS